MFYEISEYCSQSSDRHRHYCCLLSQSISTSNFKSWYLVIFSTSFWSILLSPGIAISINHTYLFSTVISGVLWARCLSVWILKSQRILTSSLCSTFSTLCSHHFSIIIIIILISSIIIIIISSSSSSNIINIYIIIIIIIVISIVIVVVI